MEKIATKQDAAKALMELFGPDGEHWTQQVNARDAAGCPVPDDSPNASCFCIFGGMHRLGLDDATKAYNDLRAALDYQVVTFNDTNDWPTVKTKLQSIAKAQA